MGAFVTAVHAHVNNSVKLQNNHMIREKRFVCCGNDFDDFQSVGPLGTSIFKKYFIIKYGISTVLIFVAKPCQERRDYAWEPSKECTKIL